MLHLQARVHLHEIEAVGAQTVAGIHDELNSPRPGIADRLRRAHRCGAHLGPHLGRHAGRGRLLDHLLVPPLQRAVAFEQMHGARPVAEDLHLDMARLLDEFFYKNGIVAKRGRRLPSGTGQGVHEIRRAATLRIPLPPPPATALISTG
jgi:hypothetical protein